MQLTEVDRERLLSVLHDHNTMTLSTVGVGRMPWSSILFYSADQDLSLVYISKRDALHSRQIDSCSSVSVSIYKDDQERSKALGLQIAGEAALIQAGEGLDHAKELYLGQYSFIRKVEELFITFKKMDFYKVTPHFVRLIENAKGMGHREEWGTLEP